MSVQDIVKRCEALFEDLDFGAVKQWKAAHPGAKAIGYMPIYVPREIVHAAGMLPVGVFGGGDQLEVIQGDAYYQSYICRIPRSTLELGLTGRLDCLDGMLFPSICDVIRNLSGMWQIMFKDKYVKYFDLPQNYDDDTGGQFYVHEMETLRKDLSSLAGRDITDENLKASIAVYNDNRKAVRELYAYRAQKPWQAPTSEVYLVLRAGAVLPPEEHTALIREYLSETEKQKRPKRDNARVVLTGSFCEQPPLGLIKSIEMAGCYVVDDDFQLCQSMLLDDVSLEKAPLAALSEAFLHRSAQTSSKYDERKEDKGRHLLRQVNKFAENTGQMAPIREQTGTFADSIKLWSAA
jgi:benzoyl-CoA reductase subunit C